MPLFGKKESFPAPRPAVPPKSFGGIFRESLFGSAKPTSKTEQKPQAKPEFKKPFSGRGYGTFEQLKTFTKKGLPFGSKENIRPGTSRQFATKEKFAVVDRMREYAKRLGISGTISEEIYRNRISPQIKKDLSKIYERTKSTESREYKSLKGDAQVFERWLKGIPK